MLASLDNVMIIHLTLPQGILPYFDQMIGKITVKLDQKFLGEITVKWFIA